jgi:hypothetical protein
MTQGAANDAVCAVQVAVFPHDEWEDLDLESAETKPTPPGPSAAETVSAVLERAYDCHGLQATAVSCLCGDC